MIKKRTLGALLLIVLGFAAVGVLYVLKPKIFERNQRQTSDAKNISETIRVTGDG